MEIIFRSGTTEQISEYVGQAGTFIIDTDKQQLFVTDGVTPGGLPVTDNAALVVIEQALNELDIESIAGLSSALSDKVDVSELGQPNGVAELNEFGVVADDQLPTYVVDIIEVADETELPETGEVGVFYLDLAENILWRWSGSTYIRISATPESTDLLPEGENNQYFTETKVRGALSGGGDITYNDETGVFGLEVDPVTAESVGLDAVPNYPPSTEEQAIEVVDTESLMTPLRMGNTIGSVGFHQDGEEWLLDEGEMGFSGEIEPLTDVSFMVYGEPPAVSPELISGDTAYNNGLTLDEGEVSVDTELNQIRIHDGETPGGFEIPKAD